MPGHCDRIAEVLTFRRTSSEQFRLLVDLALRAGTEDNETALLAQYEIPREKATTWAGY